MPIVLLLALGLVLLVGASSQGSGGPSQTGGEWTTQIIVDDDPLADSSQDMAQVQTIRVGPVPGLDGTGSFTLDVEFIAVAEHGSNWPSGTKCVRPGLWQACRRWTIENGVGRSVADVPCSTPGASTWYGCGVDNKNPLEAKLVLEGADVFLEVKQRPLRRTSQGSFASWDGFAIEARLSW